MLRCIRFGEVLLDETFRTFLICNQCQTEFEEIPEFRLHIASSVCGERLFKNNVLGLKFGAAQVTRASKEKTYLLYNPADVQIATTGATTVGNTTSAPTTTDGGDDAYLDLMKIEEELLDPRWYTDIANAHSDVESPQHTTTQLPTAANSNKTLEYKELVEAVGPYVQFKDNAPKVKNTVLNQQKQHQPRIVVRRFSNKINNPAGVPAAAAPVSAPPIPSVAAAIAPKNTALPVKREVSTDKPAIRLSNPPAKRKLDLTPKQVHFNDEVNVKYVIKEKSPKNASSVKPITKKKTENKQKTLAGEDGTVPKRRKTITIPTDQPKIKQISQEQLVRRSSDLPSATVEKLGTNITADAVSATETKQKTKATKNVTNATENNGKFKRMAGEKCVAIKLARPKSALQTKVKNVVPNPLVIQKQINDTKSQITNNNTLLVKNPVTYSKANSVNMKTEKSLPTTAQAIAPALVNKSSITTMARPQQGPVNPTTKQTSGASVTYAPAPSQTVLPPALAPLSSNKISNPAAFAAAKSVPKDAQQQTNDILNKLQTRGLQVKRTQPPMTPTAALNAANKRTMELLQKLQSKGMKVKILNGKETVHAHGAMVRQSNVSINLPNTVAHTKILNNSVNMTTNIGTQNKTLLNNKLIIKKVN